MKLTRQELTSKGKKEFEELYTLTDEQIEQNPLLIKGDNIKIKLISEYVASLTLIKIYVNGNLILKSTRSLKPTNFPLNVEDDLVLAYDQTLFDNETMILVEGDEFDFDEYIYGLIVGSIPLKVLADDEKDTISGKDWEVLTEDEYNKRKKEVNNSPFASLEDLDLD